MGAEIVATRTVPAPPHEVFAFLSDLENHWRLADRWIEVVSLDRPLGGRPEARADRGRVRMRGPLGAGRTVATRVLNAEPPNSMAGSAELGRRTRARVSWSLVGRDGETEVTLSAGLEHAGLIDRLLLALGGRVWLRRRFGSVLERLAERFAAPARERIEGRGPASSR